MDNVPMGCITVGNRRAVILVNVSNIKERGKTERELRCKADENSIKTITILEAFPFKNVGSCLPLSPLEFKRNGDRTDLTKRNSKGVGDFLISLLFSISA